MTTPTRSGVQVVASAYENRIAARRQNVMFTLTQVYGMMAMTLLAGVGLGLAIAELLSERHGE